MTNCGIWSNDKEIIRLATEVPLKLNNQVKKFFKNLFRKPKISYLDDDDDQNCTQHDLLISFDGVFNKLNEFYELIEKISTFRECSSFLDYTLDLIIGHSVIREIFLKSAYFNTNIRLNLIQLFSLICSNRIEHCRNIEHLIDFILSSYHATLSIEDQTLLQLFSILELNGFNLQKYHPFIWGRNGALFYATKHSQKLTFLHSPNIDEIFKGFDGKYLHNSLYCFPIDIPMSDKPIEIITDVKSSEKYDPRFILPMFYHFLSVQPIVKYHKFSLYGCLSYTIAALSSHCSQTRAIAYRILARFYHHLDYANYPQDRQLWIGLIDFLRSGLSEDNQRIDCVHTILFVKIIEVLLHPTCLLFPTVRNYLIRHQLKPFNYKSIPPLYNICISDISGTNQISYILHQKFVIIWIMNSLRTARDVKMWHRRHAFSDMLTYYNSPLCAEENRPLIIKILINVARLFEGVKVLCHDSAIFAWINHQLIVFQPNNITPKDLLYKLVVTIWNTVYGEFRQNSKESPSKFIFYESFCFELIMTLSKIIYKVTDQKRVDVYVDICRKSLKHIKDEKYKIVIKTLICCNLPMNLKSMVNLIEK